MKILIADDEEDVRELLALCLQADYQCDIVQANDGRQAIAALSADPAIDAVICDYMMPNANGFDVFRHVFESKHRARFVLCTGSADIGPFRGVQLAGLIEKPEIFQGLKALMPTLSATAPAAKSPVSAADSDPPAAVEWCSVRSDYLLKVNLSSCDLFIRLSDDKFVKVMHGGDAFTEDDVARYAAKRVDRFWIRRADAQRLVAKLESDLSIITKTRQIDLESSFEISKMAVETIHSLSKQIGFSKEIQALTKAGVELAVKSISDHPDVSSLFRRMMSNPEEYLAAHSVALAHTACGIAGSLGWKSDYSFFKLSLAAFLHDMPLEPELARYNTVSEMVRARVEANRTVANEEEASFIAHPVEAAAMVNEMKTSLPDVELIVRQHHERPDGSGFPDRLGHSQISPLAAVLILAEDLVAFAISRGPDFLLEDFVSQRGATYAKGQFKKIACALTSQRTA